MENKFKYGNNVVEGAIAVRENGFVWIRVTRLVSGPLPHFFGFGDLVRVVAP